MVSRSHRANAMARQSQYSDCGIGVASSCGDAGYRALRARHVACRVARLAADVALTRVGSHRMNSNLTIVIAEYEPFAESEGPRPTPPPRGRETAPCRAA